MEPNQIVKNCRLIFIAIETPHEKKFEGITKIPNKRKDFNYDKLALGTKSLFEEIKKQKTQTTVVVISTVLPGTMRSKILINSNKYVDFCYNPFFIAMGTTINDFLNSEIILMGLEKAKSFKLLSNFYKTITKSKIFNTTIENAELIKVVYNTFISTKISMINTVMETCHNIPNTNIDEITKALSLCDKRIISPKYLNGGMGDGGGCHPRDNIAMSYLANQINLSFNWYDAIMKQREEQTIWMANLCIKNLKNNKQINILGKSFKPETNLILGSPALLLKNILESKNIKVNIWDPHTDDIDLKSAIKKFKWNSKGGVFFIGTMHKVFLKFPFPNNSVIIDPFRMIKKVNKSINLISIGIGKKI